ncbi:MAG: hypothetical protein IPJ39_22345 [Saprospiraceae bacterium]|nr:hypothetical protein [Saprospiraceae bacterium]
MIDGLEAVVTGGTARVAYVEGPDICGKTRYIAKSAWQGSLCVFWFCPRIILKSQLQFCRKCRLGRRLGCAYI